MAASIMLLSNYSHSIGKLFVFLSEVVTAANLPVYFSCTLAIVMLGRQGLASAQRKRTAVIAMAAICAALYCAWASIGLGLKPLLWTIVLGAISAPVYWVSRYMKSPHQQAAPPGPA